MEILDEIDNALIALATLGLGADRVKVGANPDIHDAVLTQDGVSVGDDGFVRYREVIIRRSSAQIPEPGYTVSARLV